MAENVTADPSLSYGTSGDGDDGENIDFDYCLKLPDGWIVFSLVCVGICLCGLVGNVTVMWFLGCKMKQNPFTVYILNLAAADFSLLLLFTVFALTLWIFRGLCFYDVRNIPSMVLSAIAFLCHFFDLSSLGLLTAISVERCISVLCPLWYRCQRPKHSAGITCGVLWLLAGLLISLTYLSRMFAPSYVPACAGAVIAFSLIMALLMLISNLVLFVRLQWGSQRRRPGRLYIAVVLNLIIFFAFGIPFSVKVFLNLTTSQALIPGYTPLFLALLNSSLNPVIYVLVGSCRKHHLQCSVTGALRRVFEEKPMPEERGPVSGGDVVETSA